MKILLTGAFGNIGTHTLQELNSRGHKVRCFDLKTRANEKAARSIMQRTKPNPIEVNWGDLRHPEDLAAAVKDQDVVIHLSFVIPHLSVTGVKSEDQPDWAREINVGGTKNLLEAIQNQASPPKIIFASSLHVYGRTQDQPPPRTLSDPVQPVEHYAHHKVECEQLVKDSGLTWSIFRLPATLPIRLILDTGMFEVPLENRIEFAHGRDVGTAFAKAVSSEAVWGKTLLLGGGLRCQLYQRELVETLLERVGVGMLPDEAFSTVPYSTDWLETTESQALLDYQQRTLEDYGEDLYALLGFRLFFIRLLRPLIRAWLLRQSPHWPVHQAGLAPGVD